MLLIKNGWLITLNSNNEVIKDGALVVEGNQIKEIGSTEELANKYEYTEIIDAKGKVVMPGMINAHMHLYSTFARGMALKDEPPKDFRQILERLWWRLDKQLREEDIYYSALIPLLDCVRYGTTTIIDHHASPFAVSGSLSIIAEAIEKVGLRASLAYEVSDRDGEEIALLGIKENVSFIKICKKRTDDMLHGLFGLHASMTLSDRTLEKCREAIEGLDTGFHVHTAEGIQDVEDSLHRSGLRVVERLDKFGIWNEKSIAVHCVHINEKEMEILKERGTNVVHNPESNMGNAVGCADITTMLNKGIVVGLGTDGFTSDMFESVKVANILHKHELKDPSASWAEVPEMIFTNNQRILAKYFKNPIGQLIEGAYADVIILDYDPPTPLDETNYYGHILFGVSGGRVVTTIINGKVLMKDREIKGFDLDEIHARSRELAQKLWIRF
ncbi:chlorohydrolase [Anoxybacter fermentans]|uniref:Chlorohydrolase n=1 Tax=Anoxybacter fermentans TaxID=1323375 RepID=A0A3Q9HR94_9FIRM|nr:putative aminohydrolase SsnA [Anoxybacter fermentans]AZR73602.1 chlorohydrolase [Anoxybacter fermentans]